MNFLRIATRQSPLALRQAELVKQALLHHFPHLHITLLPLKTSGDQLLSPSSTISGKGLFTKEIEEALIHRQADIAVHSVKDLAVQGVEELEIAAYLKREDARDVLISSRYKCLSDMPQGSHIGTASIRRQRMVNYWRDDITVTPIRGNLHTRLSQLDKGLYDAIILSAAGLHRLGLTHRIQYYFPLEESLPAIGQGVIGVQCRQEDEAIKSLLRLIDHPSTRWCMMAEHALNAALGGSCHMPIGGHALFKTEENTLLLQGCVYDLKKRICLKSELSGSKEENAQLGGKLAENLLAQGASDLLK